MSWECRWFIVCENCGKRLASVGNRLAPKGWLTCWWLYDDHHLCGDCKTTPPEWWPTDALADVLREEGGD